MKIVTIAGARPNFVKIAPLIAEMNRVGWCDAELVHTGQHYDDALSRVFFDELDIPLPDYNLEVGSADRLEQIDLIMARFEPVFEDTTPDAVLVVGDVNSTVACARVARRHGCPVIHVEAGLRSFDTEMPEELNRVETDELSDLLFVTESSGMANLASESIKGDAFLVGNVMIDTLAKHIDRARAMSVHERFGLSSGCYFIGTFHRPSNVDSADNLAQVLDIVRHTAAQAPIVLPLHPRTRAALERHGMLDDIEGASGITLSEPLGYLDFISLVAHSQGVVTDSGGVQEETTFLHVPCVTMRDNTERPVTVEIGSNVLAGTNPANVKSAVDVIAGGNQKRGSLPELWDGHAAERIVDLIGTRMR